MAFGDARSKGPPRAILAKPGNPMTAPFALDPRLDGDTLALLDLELCAVRLMNDRQFPWLVLVPRRPDLRELHDLAPTDRVLLFDEIARATHALEEIHKPDKLNVAALGNVVAQLHVHVIARFRGDRAWPRPVWGVAEPVPYTADEADRVRARLRVALAGGATAPG
jgi:diadenosine tetraphosphate (Ap4A) HIT family hydrolase